MNERRRIQQRHARASWCARNKDKVKAKAARYREKHKEKLAASKRLWYAKNRTAALVRKRRHYAANKDKRRKYIEENRAAITAWHKAYREKHKERLRSEGRLYRLDCIARKKELVLNAKRMGCVDCGIADPRVLDFDHVRGTKIASISKMVNRVGTAHTLIAELAKCEVRCANCHRIKTLERRRSKP